MSVDGAVHYFTTLYHNHRLKSRERVSRTGFPCTLCGIDVSSTWRPGPCGASTLCNACGLRYMNSKSRERCIDLILRNNCQAVWVEKCNTTCQWKEMFEADPDDERIQRWVNHQLERQRMTINNIDNEIISL